MLPSGRATRIASIDTYDGELDAAFPPMSVTLLLEDDLDLGRGDMICRRRGRARAGRARSTADVCWMAERPLAPRGRYAMKHTTRTARAVVDEVEHRVDVCSLRARTRTSSALNDIGRVRLRMSAPLLADPYGRTASPAASSSSTSRRTTPSAPG